MYSTISFFYPLSTLTERDAYHLLFIPTASSTAAPASLNTPPVTTEAAVPVTFTARHTP